MKISHKKVKPMNVRSRVEVPTTKCSAKHVEERGIGFKGLIVKHLKIFIKFFLSLS